MFRSLPFPGFTLQDMCTCGHQQNMTVGVSCWCPQVSIFYSWRSSFWWNSAYNQTVDDCCVEGWWVCKSHVVDTGESIIMHLDGFQHHLRRNFACRLGAVASARFCQDPLHWYECGIGALVWTGVQILAVCNCWAIRNLSCPSHSCTLLEFGSQIWISTWVWDESGGGFRCELSMTRIILLEAWLDNGGRFSTRKFVLFTSFVRVLHWKICVSHQFCMGFTSFVRVLHWKICVSHQFCMGVALKLTRGVRPPSIIFYGVRLEGMVSNAQMLPTYRRPPR